jgi:hypothetical protein
MAVIRELLTREDFLRAVRDGAAIVITGKGKAARFHPSGRGCEHVTLEDFSEKVLTNERRHGSYFAVDNRSEAEQRWTSLSACWGVAKGWL